MNPLFLIILGTAAYIYLPTIWGMLKLDIRIKMVVPTQISSDLVRLNVSIEYGNPTSRRIDLQALDAEVYLNGMFIGTLTQNYQVPILPGRKQIVGNNIDLSPQNLTTQLWLDVLNFNLKNMVLEIRGKVTANNRSFPYNAIYTIDDFKI